MIPGQEFLAAYPAKLMEYGLAVIYLALFVPFWRYLRIGKGALRTAEVPAPMLARAAQPHAADGPGSWFTIPAPCLLHPGHSWARLGEDGLVTVGLDDFAHKLVGPADWFSLPEEGAELMQGAPACALGVGAKSVDLLAPVDGRVVAVNPQARAGQSDPYGEGWLYKLSASRLPANARQLFSGATAQRWLDAAGAELAARSSPGLGQVLQDGGTPVTGLAHELDPEKWDELARKFLLS